MGYRKALGWESLSQFRVQEEGPILKVFHSIHHDDLSLLFIWRKEEVPVVVVNKKKKKLCKVLHNTTKKRETTEQANYY